MVRLIMSDSDTHINLDVIVKLQAVTDKVPYVIFPESGLHPSQHTEITEKLHKQGGNWYVATHSELVILRAMRMIREGRATLDDFELWQTGRREDGKPYMTHRKFSEDGEFLDHIKGGFFEEGFNERFS